MTPIPLKIRRELAELPRMRVCTLKSLQRPYGACEGRVEWHHVFLYGGRRVNEVWSILGVCHRHHEMVKGNREVQSAFEGASLMLTKEGDLEKYPKKNWKQIKKSLGI